MRKIAKSILVLLLALAMIFGVCACAAADLSLDAQSNHTVEAQEDDEAPDKVDYHFRSEKLLQQHYEKHGIDMGFQSPEAYENAASAVVNDPNALHKTEAEDGDFVYYIESSNEFVVLSKDGYLRTYFLPDSGKRYFDKQ